MNKELFIFTDKDLVDSYDQNLQDAYLNSAYDDKTFIGSESGDEVFCNEAQDALFVMEYFD